jgi:hypothetical protein
MNAASSDATREGGVLTPCHNGEVVSANYHRDNKSKS